MILRDNAAMPVQIYEEAVNLFASSDGEKYLQKTLVLKKFSDMYIKCPAYFKQCSYGRIALA